MSSTYKIFVDKMGGSNTSAYIGKLGELFYNPASGSLRISDGSTPGGNPIAIESAVEVYDEDLLPSLDNTWSLGSASLRWKAIYVGPGSLWLQDTNNAGLNVELTVTDGVLLLNGASTLQLGNLQLNPDGISTTDTTSDIVLGNSGDTGQIAVYRPIVLKDGNDNVILQFTTDSDGQGKITYGGGSIGITMGDGLAINGISHQDYTSGSQVLSYATSTGKVTYGQINYSGILGFPRMPNFATDELATAAVGTPLKGHMYYNTTADKVHVWTGSSWHGMN